MPEIRAYDIVIIGGGIGGLMSAYRLKKNDSDLKIAITECGNVLEKRICPAGKNSSCVHCEVCSITKGFAGLARLTKCNILPMGIIGSHEAKRLPFSGKIIINIEQRAITFPLFL